MFACYACFLVFSMQIYIRSEVTRRSGRFNADVEKKHSARQLGNKQRDEHEQEYKSYNIKSPMTLITCRKIRS